jgi:hypothetical protein
MILYREIDKKGICSAQTMVCTRYLSFSQLWTVRKTLLFYERKKFFNDARRRKVSGHLFTP